MRALSLLGALHHVDVSAFDRFVGVSMGSLIALGLALGFTPSELGRLFLEINLSRFGPSPEDVFEFPRRWGLSDGSSIRRLASAMLASKGHARDAPLSALPSLEIVVSDLVGRRAVVLHGSGPSDPSDPSADPPIALAVQASCSIPFVFSPVRPSATGPLWVDGCLYCADPASLLPCSLSLLVYDPSARELGSLWEYVLEVLDGPRQAFRPVSSASCRIPSSAPLFDPSFDVSARRDVLESGGRYYLENFCVGKK